MVLKCSDNAGTTKTQIEISLSGEKKKKVSKKRKYGLIKNKWLFFELECLISIHNRKKEKKVSIIINYNKTFEEKNTGKYILL